MANLSPDTVAQIIATVAIGAIAVWGSIRGAKVGAEVGAAATRAATQQQIDAQRDAAREQRQHEDRAALQAVATECRLNARLLREKRQYMPDPRFMAPLRQSSLDAATSAIATLPDDLREASQQVVSDVLWFNRLIATRLALLDERGDTVARALRTEVIELGSSLPDRLDALAARLDAENRSPA
jgi:hypothetical protein